MAEKTIASLTINGIGKMTRERRRQIADWLCDLSTEVSDNGDKYTDGRFRARFYDNPKPIIPGPPDPPASAYRRKIFA